jgi:hypothetical protein
MRRNWRLRLFEFLLWVLAASAGVVVASLAIGLVVGDGLVAVKTVMFVVGFLLFGIGSLLMQPSGSRSGGAGGGAAGNSGAARRGAGGVGGSGPGGVSGGGESPRTGQPAADERGSDRSGLFGFEAPDLPALRQKAEAEAGGEHRYEARLQEVGPLSAHHLPYEDRVGRGFKIFATGVVVLAVSFLMEVVGVHA